MSATNIESYDRRTAVPEPESKIPSPSFNELMKVLTE